MAETLHEMAVRMVKGEDCQSQHGKGCKKCPADKLRSANGICLMRGIVKAENCEEQIEGLKAWAKEHPGPRYPSWKDGWQSLFPGGENPCPKQWFCEDCPKDMDCFKCTERPMSKKVAEKLGIKPITTAKVVPEHDGCEGCRWMNKHDDEEPCKNCCGVRGGSAPDLWEEEKYE